MKHFVGLTRILHLAHYREKIYLVVTKYYVTTFLREGRMSRVVLHREGRRDLHYTVRGGQENSISKRQRSNCSSPLTTCPKVLLSKSQVRSLDRI